MDGGVVGAREVGTPVSMNWGIRVARGIVRDGAIRYLEIWMSAHLQGSEWRVVRLERITFSPSGPLPFPLDLDRDKNTMPSPHQSIHRLVG